MQVNAVRFQGFWSKLKKEWNTPYVPPYDKLSDADKLSIQKTAETGNLSDLSPNVQQLTAYAIHKRNFPTIPAEKREEALKAAINGKEFEWELVGENGIIGSFNSYDYR